MAHIQSIIIHGLQCHILNIFQYGNSLPLLCINTRGKTMGMGKYNTLAQVVYITLTQVLKFLLVFYHRYYL